MDTTTTVKDQFDKQGFLHVPGVIPTREINTLREATECILKEDVSRDILKTEGGVPRKICYLFDKGEIYLEMLSHPAVIGLATSLAFRPDWLVPTWEDMLIKPAHTGIPVQVHQDLALQTVNGRVFSIGIYLHDAIHNPVYFLPESHQLGPLTREQIKEIWHTRKRDFQPVYAATGDLVAHDVLTVHYSESNESPFERYTWYLEFRDLDQLIQNQIWPRDWCLGRRAILFRSQMERMQRGLASVEIQFPDSGDLKAISNVGELRFPHETGNISYDLKSPYNHFIDSISLMSR
jgi:hypothetical protein